MIGAVKSEARALFQTIGARCFRVPKHSPPIRARPSHLPLFPSFSDARAVCVGRGHAQKRRKALWPHARVTHRISRGDRSTPAFCVNGARVMQAMTAEASVHATDATVARLLQVSSQDSS